MIFIALDEIFEEIFWDSTALLNVCFNSVSKQIAHKTLGNTFLEELSEYVQSDSVVTDSIIAYRITLDTLFISTVDEFLLLTDDSSTYYQVKNRLEYLIAIESELAPNEEVIAKLKYLVKNDNVDISFKTAGALALLKLKSPLSKEYWDDLYIATENTFKVLTSLIQNEALDLLSKQ